MNGYICLIMKKILVINGPNLNLIGIREPKVYGGLKFEEYFNELKSKSQDFELEFYQSNVEGE
mgnify:FL=1